MSPLRARRTLTQPPSATCASTSTATRFNEYGVLPTLL